MTYAQRSIFRTVKFRFGGGLAWHYCATDFKWLYSVPHRIPVVCAVFAYRKKIYRQVYPRSRAVMYGYTVKQKGNCECRMEM